MEKKNKKKIYHGYFNTICLTSLKLRQEEIFIYSSKIAGKPLIYIGLLAK